MELVAILNGAIHILAAIAVIGGSFFANTVLKKATKGLPPAQQGQINQAVGKNFSIVVWVSIGLLLITGVARSLVLGLFAPQVLFGTTYGNLLFAKLVLFAVIIVISALIGQTAVRMVSAGAGDGPPPIDIIRTAQSRINRLSLMALVLGVLVVILAVTMRFLGAP